MKILHLGPAVGPRAFGLGPPPSFLAANQQRTGHLAEIWTVGESKEELAITQERYRLGTGTLRSFKRIGPRSFAYSPALVSELLARDGLKYDVLHVHGIWTSVSWAAGRWGGQTRKPVVVAAHGSLQPWALKRYSWKKQLALCLYEERNLRKAACLHAVAEAEVANYRRLGLHGPVAVIPNGIDEEWIDAKVDKQSFRNEVGVPPNLRLALFLSRITPTKGLPMLIDAVERLRSRLGGWLFVIAGQDEFGHQGALHTLIRRRNLEPLFRFVGPLHGEPKRAAFAASDLFVLPTHSEGAPIVILEALGAGLPVLTTKGAPWPQLIANHCGWWTEISTGAIQQALAEAVSKPASELRLMGASGRELVRREFLWTECARRTIRLYQWLQGHGDVPEFVHFS